MAIPHVTDEQLIETAWGNAVADAVNANTTLLARVARGLAAPPRIGTASAWNNATAVYSDITVTAGQSPQLTLALDTTRRYRFVLATVAKSTAAVDRIAIGLSVNGAAPATDMLLVIQNFSAYVRFETLIVPASSAAVVYKAQARGVGGGTVDVGGTSAVVPMVFYCEDVGAV